jgi:dephospho-CoA kinase
MTEPLKRTYRIIGLTGGIGSGKSTVARRFAELGATVYSADELARQALEPGESCYQRVINEFGESILTADGTINRKALAKIVFFDEKQRQKLNEIIHPYVIETLFSRAEAELSNKSGAIAIFDVPLLFESGLDAQMDKTITVSCEESERVHRIIARDQASPEQALQRIRAQMPEEERRQRADYILDNNGSVDELICQVDALFELLKAEEPRS